MGIVLALVAGWLLAACLLPLHATADPAPPPPDAIPRTPGRHRLTMEGWQGRAFSRPLGYVLQVPKEVAEGAPLPLVVANSYRSRTEGAPGCLIEAWRGFEGYVAVVVNPCTAPDLPEMIRAIAERLVAEGMADRREILVMEWRSGYELARCVGERPDLFRFGFSDSTWCGPSSWPALPAVDEESRARLRDAHVSMRMSGEGTEGGYDDATFGRVQAYWESLGVRDAAIERYPDGSYGGEGGAAARGRLWFLEKLEADRRSRDLRAEYERRVAALPGGDAPARARLGAWCESRGLVVEAVAAYRGALEIDPEYAAARRALGRLPGGE